MLRVKTMRACANCACGCANVAKVGVLCVVVCMSALFVRVTGVHVHDHALPLESHHLSFQLPYNFWHEKS